MEYTGMVRVEEATVETAGRIAIKWLNVTRDGKVFVVKDHGEVVGVALHIGNLTTREAPGMEYVSAQELGLTRTYPLP